MGNFSRLAGYSFIGNNSSAFLGKPLQSAMSLRTPSHLKTHRKRLGLAQQELALLLGCERREKVARIERFSRKPNLEVALAFEVIFEISFVDLFPDLYAAVETSVIERAHVLANALTAHNPTPQIERKLNALRAIIARRQRV